MSGRQHFDATLRGFGKPVFPARIKDLNVLFDKTLANGILLEKIGRQIPGFIRKESLIVTTDVYAWFDTMYIDGGDPSNDKHMRILVTFPAATDHRRLDGLKLDRSIAIYTNGDISDQQLDDLVEKLIKGFEQV